MSGRISRRIPPDYRLHHIRIVSVAQVPPTAFHGKQPARPTPGSDIGLTLDHTTRRGSHLDVVALAIEITRGARSVHVMGGTVALRQGVAAALGAVFGGTGDECPVTWAAPGRTGPRTAPRPYAFPEE